MHVLIILLLFSVACGQNICSKFTPNLVKIYQCVNVSQKLVTFMILTETPSSSIIIEDFLNDMLSKISTLETQFFIRRLHVNFEYDVIDYSELFSWRGECFKLRETQENRTITYDGTSAAHPKQRFRDAFSASVVVIAENIDILLRYLVGSPRSPFQSTRKIFNIVLLEKPENVEDKVSLVLGRMWRNYGIMIAVLVFTCDDHTVNYMDQFNMKPGRTNATDYVSWGNLEKAVVDVNLTTICNRNFDNFPKNLNGYPIRVLLFEEDPVSISWDSLPQSFISSNLGKLRKQNPLTAGYNGLTIAGLVDYLKFTPIYIQPVNTNETFGSRAKQGHLTGSLKVVYSKYDFVGNSHFVVARYGLDYDYLHPVFFDNYCIIAPKAKRIPLHLAPQKCFTRSTWLVIMAIPWILAFALKAINSLRPYKESSSLSLNTWCLILFFYYMLASISLNIRTKAQTDRWILASCMAFGIIFVTIVGANLTSYLTTDIRFKEINTLKELADSDLKITVSVPFFKNIAFGNGDSSNDDVIKKLKSNLVLGNDSIYNPAIGKGCVFRKMVDFRLVNRKITAEYGENKLHLVKECPSTYFSAFVVRRGWSFTSIFNNRIHRILEAGLTQFWRKSSTHALELNVDIKLHRTDERNFQLTIDNSYIWFAAVLVGHFLGVCVFCCEIWWSRKNKTLTS